MSDSFATPRTLVCQAPLFMRFPRQEYWSGLPFSSPGDLSDPGIKRGSLVLAGGFFTIWPTREAHLLISLKPKYNFLLFYKCLNHNHEYQESSSCDHGWEDGLLLSWCHNIACTVYSNDVVTILLDFQDSLVVQMVESDCNERDWGSIPGSERSPGEGNGNPLQLFLPGKSHGWRSLAGYNPWDRKELEMTERLIFSLSL